MDIVSAFASDEYIEFTLTDKGAGKIKNPQSLKLVFNSSAINCKIIANESTVKIIPTIDRQIEEYVSEYLMEKPPVS